MINTYVNSSVIRALGYDRATQIMHVHFNDGHVYQYHGVPELLYTAFRMAPSKGQFYNWKFRDGRFNGIRIN